MQAENGRAWPPGGDGEMSKGELLVASEGAVLRLTINRPEKRNALSRALLAELRAAFDGHAEAEDHAATTSQASTALGSHHGRPA